MPSSKGSNGDLAKSRKDSKSKSGTRSPTGSVSSRSSRGSSGSRSSSRAGHKKSDKSSHSHGSDRKKERSGSKKDLNEEKDDATKKSSRKSDSKKSDSKKSGLKRSDSKQADGKKISKPKKNSKSNSSDANEEEAAPQVAPEAVVATTAENPVAVPIAQQPIAVDATGAGTVSQPQDMQQQPQPQLQQVPLPLPPQHMQAQQQQQQFAQPPQPQAQPQEQQEKQPQPQPQQQNEQLQQQQQQQQPEQGVSNATREIGIPALPAAQGAAPLPGSAAQPTGGAASTPVAPQADGQQQQQQPVPVSVGASAPGEHNQSTAAVANVPQQQQQPQAAAAQADPSAAAVAPRDASHHHQQQQQQQGEQPASATAETAQPAAPQPAGTAKAAESAEGQAETQQDPRSKLAPPRAIATQQQQQQQPQQQPQQQQYHVNANQPYGYNYGSNPYQNYPQPWMQQQQQRMMQQQQMMYPNGWAQQNGYGHPQYPYGQQQAQAAGQQTQQAQAPEQTASRDLPQQAQTEGGEKGSTDAAMTKKPSFVGLGEDAAKKDGQAAASNGAKEGINSMYGAGGPNSMYGAGGPNSMYGPMGQNSMYGPMGQNSMYGPMGQNSMYGQMGQNSMYRPQSGFGGGWGSMMNRGSGYNSMYGMGGGMGSMYGLNGSGSMYQPGSMYSFGMGGSMYGGPMRSMYGGPMGSMYGPMGSMYGLRGMSSFFGMGSMYGGPMGSMYGPMGSMYGLGGPRSSSFFGTFTNGPFGSHMGVGYYPGVMSRYLLEQAQSTYNRGMYSLYRMEGHEEGEGDGDSEKKGTEASKEKKDDKKADAKKKDSEGKKGATSGEATADGGDKKSSPEAIKLEEKAVDKEAAAETKEGKESASAATGGAEESKNAPEEAAAATRAIVKNSASRGVKSHSTGHDADHINTIVILRPAAAAAAAKPASAGEETSKSASESEKPTLAVGGEHHNEVTVALKADERKSYHVDEIIVKDLATSKDAAEGTPAAEKKEAVHIESAILKDIAEHTIAGHNVGLLVMNTTGEENAAAALITDMLNTFMTTLEARKATKGSGYDVLFSLITLEDKDKLRDAFNDNKVYSEFTLGSNPLYGPHICNVNAKKFEKHEEAESITNSIITAAKTPSELPVGLFIVKQYRKKEDNSYEVLLSSIFISYAGNSSSHFAGIADNRSSAPVELFRYAVTGPCATVAILCAKEDETDAPSANDLLECVVKVGKVKNAAPHSGNVERFVEYTRKDIPEVAGKNGAEDLNGEQKRKLILARDAAELLRDAPNVEPKVYRSQNVASRGRTKVASTVLIVEDSKTEGSTDITAIKDICKDQGVDEVIRVPHQSDEKEPLKVSSDSVAAVLRSFIAGSNGAVLAVDSTSVAPNAYVSPAWSVAREAVSVALERSGAKSKEVRVSMTEVEEKDELVHDLLSGEPGKAGEPMTIASSPLFGTSVHNAELKLVTDLAAYDTYVAEAKKCGVARNKPHSIAIISVIFRLTTEEDTFVTSFTLAIANAVNNPFAKFAQQTATENMRKLFSHAIGGPWHSAVLLSVKAGDAGAAALITEAKSYSGDYNMPLRSGSIKKFVGYLQQTLAATAKDGGAEQSATHRRNERAVADHRAVLENPETVFPPRYLTEKNKGDDMGDLMAAQEEGSKPARKSSKEEKQQPASSSKGSNGTPAPAAATAAAPAQAANGDAKKEAAVAAAAAAKADGSKPANAADGAAAATRAIPAVPQPVHAAGEAAAQPADASAAAQPQDAVTTGSRASRKATNPIISFALVKFASSGPTHVAVDGETNTITVTPPPTGDAAKDAAGAAAPVAFNVTEAVSLSESNPEMQSSELVAVQRQLYLGGISALIGADVPGNNDMKTEVLWASYTTILCQVLATPEEDTVYSDVTFSCALIKGEHVLRDYVETTQEKLPEPMRLRLMTSPLYGPCIAGVTQKRVSDATELETMITNALTTASTDELRTGDALLIAGAVYKQAKANGDVVLSYFVSTSSPSGFAPYVRIIENEDRRAMEVFREILGGHAKTVCIASVDGGNAPNTIEVLQQQAKISAIKNLAPRKGSVKEFIASYRVMEENAKGKSGEVGGTLRTIGTLSREYEALLKNPRGDLPVVFSGMGAIAGSQRFWKTNTVCVITEAKDAAAAQVLEIDGNEVVMKSAHPEENQEPRHFQCTEVIGSSTPGEVVEPKIMEEVATAIAGGVNVAVLTADSNASMGSGTAVIKNLVNRAMQKVGKGSVLYVGACAIKEGNQVRILSSDSNEYEPLTCVSSPLFGVCVNNVNFLPVTTFEAASQLIDSINQKVGEEASKVMVAFTFAWKQLVEATGDVLFSSLTATRVIGDASPYLAALEDRHSAGVLEDAIGGAIYTTFCFGINSADASAPKLLESLEKLGKVKNVSPTSGSALRFVNRVQKHIATIEKMKQNGEEGKTAGRSASFYMPYSNIPVTELQRVLGAVENMLAHPNDATPTLYIRRA